MAQMTLAQMRAKLQEVENKKNKFAEGGDNANFQFWNIPENSTAVLRFLPDGNDDNAYFWKERMVVKLPFPGTKGGDTNKPITVQVPCLEMYGKTCPIQEEIKEWWKDDAMVESARTYYKKRSYLYQAFVVTNPLKEDSLPENPIRRLVINKGIHDKIKAALMDSDIEDMPTDFENGLDFRLIKTKKGQWANYDTSSFSRKTRALNEEELAAIEKFGLFDLQSFLPKEPTPAQIKMIMEMFEASVNNELFDAERFKDFRSSGAGAATSTTTDDEATATTSTSSSAALNKLKAKTAPVQDEATESEEVAETKVSKLPSKSEDATTTSAPKKSPQDVLAMLKQRKAEKEGN